jgi:P-type conjugative transfer protein TrbG
MITAALLLAAAAAVADGPVRDSAAAVPVAVAERSTRPKAVIAKPDALIAAVAEVHPWWDGAVYHLATAPERVSEIALQPGETLISVAAGDTARWVIGDTVSGSGPARRTHIIVKPAASGLRTNLVITTDRRVYHLELSSGLKAMTGIAWTYPQDELLALKRAQAALAAAEPVAGPIAVERLNFNYAIEGDAPPWRPVRAFDDGAQIFIEFSPTLDSTEAPPLFVVGASGKPELVNYRKRGRYYVVDRLFTVAELRLGGKRQQLVRITRNDGTRQRKRSWRAS